MAFETKADRAQWRILVEDLFSDAKTGEVVTWDAISEATGSGRGSLGSIVEQVKNWLMKHQGRSLEAIPGKGYMVVSGGALVRQALYHGRKEVRQIERQVRRFTNVKREELTAGEQQLVDGEGERASRQLDMRRREQRQANKTERLLNQVRSPKPLRVVRGKEGAA